jgi:allophanate hydrolase
MIPTLGWTLAQWRHAYSQGHRPEALLLPLVEALHAQPHPAWIHLATWADIQQQLQAIAGQSQLPLYGVPIAVKDNIDVAQMPTTAACPEVAYTAAQDATVVARLRAAGAVVLGKTNMDQFATGLVGTRSPYGAVPNSFSAAHVSGGSSSGSAVAVANGWVPISLGTDTAGSGRVPAGFNNIVGLKPSRGRLSNRGLLPACQSLDVISVFALCVDDAEQVLQLAEGFDPDDGYSRQAPERPEPWPESPRLGVPQHIDWYGDTAAAAAWEESLAALKALGVTPEPMDFGPMVELAQLLYGGAWVAERWAAVGHWITQDLPGLDPTVKRLISAAGNFSAADAFAAEHLRARLSQRLHQHIKGLDGLLVPTAPCLPTLAEVAAEPVAVNARLGTFTNFVNFADLSALALPAALRQDGLPFGITLIGRSWQDQSLAAFGRHWEAQRRLPLGAFGGAPAQAVTLEAPQQRPAPPPGYLRLAVVGAHLRGMPLNGQLLERRCRLVGEAQTAPCYRLFALANTQPPKPGLARQAGGVAIALELWDMPLSALGSFLALIPAPLGLGQLELADGHWVNGFICEPWGLEGAEDISSYGGWRAYLAR